MYSGGEEYVKPRTFRLQVVSLRVAVPLSRGNTRGRVLSIVASWRLTPL